MLKQYFVVMERKRNGEAVPFRLFEDSRDAHDYADRCNNECNWSDQFYVVGVLMGGCE